jgi:hypothetical protein
MHKPHIQNVRENVAQIEDNSSQTGKPALSMR